VFVFLLLDAAADEPPDLGDYEIFQYINLHGPAPAMIAGLDTNGEILVSCKETCSRDELATKGIHFVESQLQLLQIMGLLKDTNGDLRTAFPILGKDETTQIRSITSAAASEMFQHISPLVGDLRQAMDSEGFSQNTFAIVFGYVLDGLVWQELNRLVPASTECPNGALSPFWSGQVWAMYPKRARTIGTNTHYEAGWMLYVVWSSATKNALAPMYGPNVDVGMVLRQLSMNDVVSEGPTRTVFSDIGLVDDSGKPLIPIIDCKSDDVFQQASRRLANAIAANTIRTVNLQQLSNDLRLPDAHTAMTISYHELMWDLLDLLEARGTLARPRVLSDPSTEPQSAAGIAFIVRDSDG
jgi:hypothetical protein